MLIVALVLAVIGLAALVTAVVTSNEVIAWVCIAASSLGVILLIVDAVRERQSKLARRSAAMVAADEALEDEALEDEALEEEALEEEVLEEEVLEDEVLEDEAREDEALSDEIAEEDHPEELVHDEPDYDTYSDDEPEYPESAEESALHTVVDVDAEATEKFDEQAGEQSGR